MGTLTTKHGVTVAGPTVPRTPRGPFGPRAPAWAPCSQWAGSGRPCTTRSRPARAARVVDHGDLGRPDALHTPPRRQPRPPTSRAPSTGSGYQLLLRSGGRELLARYPRST